MKQESGRSLIEILGVLAITGVMAAASIGMYSMMHRNLLHKNASATLEQLVQDTKMLMGMRGSYEGISVDYLIKAGALKSDKAPIGGDDWSVNASADGVSFIITLTDLSHGDCAYLATAVPQWTSAIMVNSIENSAGENCFSNGLNQVSFIVE